MANRWMRVETRDEAIRHEIRHAIGREMIHVANASL